jgi:hypothetical protein
MNPMIDLFLVLVDRDGVATREQVAEAREAEHAGRLLVCLAIEEIEVWMLALHRPALGQRWPDVRAERDPKERYAEPFLEQRAPKGSKGRGRAWAMRELGQGYRGVLDVCEELKELRDRIAGL